MHNLPRLVRAVSCTLLVHPGRHAWASATAGARGVEGGHGDRRRRVTETMRPGVVSLPHGFGTTRPARACLLRSLTPA
jgi:hypothetical protein